MPDAPIDIDLSAELGPWPGITVTGITGPGAAALNGNYAFRTNEDGGWQYDHVSGNGSKIRAFTLPTWSIELTGTDVQFEGDASAPWTVANWVAVASATGTPALALWVAPPQDSPVEGAVATVQATMTTNLTGTNNDLAYTAVPPGRLGNAIQVIYRYTGTNNEPLDVNVQGFIITVTVATNGSAVITTTAAQVKAAIEASPAASALVTVANAPGNNGTGVVTAMAAEDLADGEGGLPPPPVSVTI